MTKRKRNDNERRLWIENDEGMYNWQRSSGQGMHNFISTNRSEIDAAIDRALDVKSAD